MQLPPISTRCMTDADWAELKWFKKTEFKRPEKMGYEFLKWLDAVRAEAKVPMFILSSHRSEQQNRDAGGARSSAHLDEPCNAVDIVGNKGAVLSGAQRLAIVRAALKLGCERLGIYENGTVHLDRSGRVSSIWVKWGT